MTTTITTTTPRKFASFVEIMLQDPNNDFDRLLQVDVFPASLEIQYRLTENGCAHARKASLSLYVSPACVHSQETSHDRTSL